ncbi:recombinase family protein [Serratia sp. 3ACOL1]|uniref:recombinase family protein n=1 Tax=Serratia sp. 3ACOL1 TaxID=2448483 RepID=UPI000EF466AD|nr:recombinase family protein [Serratia sp. 3ACOL1]AYM91578.1 recombinase family protein [Serratia sp. 3ACOL1]
MVFHFYLACSDTKAASHIRQDVTFKEICKEFPISPDNVVIEIVDEKQSVLHQRLLKELINQKANKGDTIILNGLSSLGRNVEDILDILFFCFKKDINIYCHHPYTRIEPSVESCMSFLISVQTGVDIQNLKSSRSKHRRIKKPLGRKEGSQHKLSIYTLKLKGYKQSEVARELGVSLSTVKRHWNNEIFG